MPIKNALYGLEESGFVWEEHCRRTLKKDGWTNCTDEPSLYKRPAKDGQGDDHLLVYIDDLLLCSSNHKEVWADIGKLFEMKEPERWGAGTFIGIGGSTNSDAGSPPHVQQCEYVRKTTQTYFDTERDGKVPGRKVGTPMAPDGDEEGPSKLKGNPKSYLGSLLFLCRCSRPDVAYAVVYLARYVTCWTSRQDRMLDRLMRYLRLTQNARLTSRCGAQLKDVKHLSLDVYVDSDLGGDPETRKSTGGLLVYLTDTRDDSRTLLEWRSKRQSQVSLSSAEAEVVAIVEGVKIAMKIAEHTRFCLNVDLKVRIYSDAQAAIAACKSGYSARLAYMGRTQGINVSWMSAWLEGNGLLEQAQSRELIKVPTLDNAADLLTKALGLGLFEKHCKFLGLEFEKPLSSHHESNFCHWLADVAMMHPRRTPWEELCPAFVRQLIL